MRDKLDDLLSDHQLYHSNLQIDCFITAKSGGMTAYGQYKQSLRELFKRYRGLKELFINRKLLLIDIEEHKMLSLSEDNKFEAQRHEVKLIKCEMDLEDLDKNIEDTKREFCRFFAISIALKDKLGDISNKRDKLDSEMWVNHIKEMAARDFLSGSRLTERTLSILQSLPVAMRNSVYEEIKDSKKVTDWYMLGDHNLPEPESENEIMKLFSDMPKFLGLSNQ